ncbi:MAG: selenocysteine-specific translation elongation factor [Anaerolineales bacterium]
MRVIGTAGHVDHGKSTLVQALTGIDPDRLQEEKDRQMTIDLGFAWMTLPSGEGLGFIDVPGHRDFIENMLAGVGGIDAALLVIAADEGIMPQTREHLAILDLLEIEALVVAHTRIDLVQELEWIDLVEEDTRALLSETRFGDAPMVRVSAVTGEGTSELLDVLDSVLESARARPSSQRPRLPIDRAFTIAGFGTVVTGTLLDGPLEKGQEIEILPHRIGARIRGLQTHKETVEVAEPGSRVAANITGASVDQIERGDVVSLPGTDAPSSRLDVQFRALENSGIAIRHNTTVKFYSGSAQRIARVRLLQVAPLKGGEHGWLQLEMEKPVAVRRGDHFILRQPSPGATLGGGRIADPYPVGRHKRADDAVIEGLKRLMSGSPKEVLLASITGPVPTGLKDAAQEAGMSPTAAAEEIQRLQEAGELVLLNERVPPEHWLALSFDAWESYVSRTEDVLGAFHREHPLRGGMLVEEFRNRIGYSGSELLDALANHEIVSRIGNRVRLAEFEIVYSADQERSLGSLLERFANNPYSPPSLKESRESIGGDLLDGLIENGQLVNVGEGVVFLQESYVEMIDRITERLQAEGEITVAQVRDMFETSRKYALTLMEHLDSIGLTFRDGDARRLVRSQPE